MKFKFTKNQIERVSNWIEERGWWSYSTPARKGLTNFWRHDSASLLKLMSNVTEMEIHKVYGYEASLIGILESLVIEAYNDDKIHFDPDTNSVWSRTTKGLGDDNYEIVSDGPKVEALILALEKKKRKKQVDAEWMEAIRNGEDFSEEAMNAVLKELDFWKDIANSKISLKTKETDGK